MPQPEFKTLQTLALQSYLHQLATFQATATGGDGPTDLPREDPP